MPQALFLGGPCDQQTKQIPDKQFFVSWIKCGGARYFHADSGGSPRALVAYNHVWVILKSGPCDGEQRGLTVDKFNAGMLTCKGHTYVNVLKNGHPWQNDQGAYIWQEGRALADSVAPHAAYSTQGAYTAMHKTLRSLAHYVPQQIDREQAALRRIRKAVK